MSAHRYEAPGPLEPAPVVASNGRVHDHSTPPSQPNGLLTKAIVLAQVLFFVVAIVVFSLGISGLSSKVTGSSEYDEIFTVMGSLFIVPFVVIVLRFVTPYAPSVTPRRQRYIWYFALRAVLLVSYVAQVAILLVYMATYMTDVSDRMYLLFLAPDIIVFILMLLPSRFTTVWSHLYVIVMAVKLGLLWSYLDAGPSSGGFLGRAFDVVSVGAAPTRAVPPLNSFYNGAGQCAAVLRALWNGGPIPFSRRIPLDSPTALSYVLDSSSRAFNTAGDSISDTNSELGVNGLLSTLMLSIPMVNYPAILSKLQSGMTIFDSYAHNMAAVFAHTIHLMDVLEMYMLGVQRLTFASTVQYMILIFSLMGFVSCNIYYTSLFFSDAAVDRMIRRFQPTAMDSLETASLDQTLLHYFMWVVFFVDLPYAAMRWVAFCVHGTQLSTFFAKNIVMLVAVSMLMMYHGRAAAARK